MWSSRTIALLGKKGTHVRGHSFHCSRIVAHDSLRCAYRVHYSLSGRSEQEGFVRGRTLGTYIHLHFRSNPSLVSFFLQQASSAGSFAEAQMRIRLIDCHHAHVTRGAVLRQPNSEGRTGAHGGSPGSSSSRDLSDSRVWSTSCIRWAPERTSLPSAISQNTRKRLSRSRA